MNDESNFLQKKKAHSEQGRQKRDISSRRKEGKVSCFSYSEKVSSAKTLLSILSTYSCLSTVKKLNEALAM